MIYSKDALTKIRYNLNIKFLVCNVLNLEHKEDAKTKYLRFICPKCNEMNCSIHYKTNLCRCFTCKQNFNTIDLTMICKNISFKNAVNLLTAFIRI
jgi:Zn finger protein HypA/HybF involved in hydrogenase expression